MENFTPTKFNTEQNSILKLSVLAIVIGILAFLGLQTMVPDGISFSDLVKAIASAPYLIFPALLIAPLFVAVAYRIGIRTYQREGVSVQAFLFGVSVYILFVFIIVPIADFVALKIVRSAAQDLQFLTGMLYSIAKLTSLQIAYLGLLLCMGLLLLGIKRNVPVGQQVIANALFRYSIIGFLIIATMYVFGVSVPAAKVTQQDSLCNLAYGKTNRANCIAQVARTGSVSQIEGFDVEETQYSSIDNLQEVNGKLAYRFREGAGEYNLMLDGKVIDTGVRSEIAMIAGSPAYKIGRGGTETRSETVALIWDGKEYGSQYDAVRQVAEVGNKLAFTADINSDHSVVVWDGKEYDEEYSHVHSLQEINGQLAYVGLADAGNYVHVGDAKYGPYPYNPNLQFTNGQIVIGQNNHRIINGETVTGACGTGTYVYTDNGLACSYRRGTDLPSSHILVVEDGREVGMFDSTLGLFNINGKLGFIGTNDGVTKLYIDGNPTGADLGDVQYVYVSDQGKVATFTKISDLDWVVRIDGDEVYRGIANPTYGTSNFGFYGEKLLFEIYTDKSGTKALWYDGEVIGSGYELFQTALVDDKLVIAAGVKSSSGAEFTLLFEE